MEKSDFSGHQFGVQKPQQKPVSPEGPQFKNMCGHTCLQGMANNRSRRCKTMETQRYAKPLSRTRGNNRNLNYFSPGGKILPTKRPPFWGPKTDPKTGAKSPGHKQIKLRLSEWTPFWGPFLDPKTGAVLSAKLLSPSEKKHKFRLFLMYATKVSHTAGFPWFCSAASTCSPHPNLPCKRVPPQASCRHNPLPGNWPWVASALQG